MIICVSRSFSGAIGLHRPDCAPYPELGQDHLNQRPLRIRIAAYRRRLDCVGAGHGQV
jgi:hypothetical protein